MALAGSSTGTGCLVSGSGIAFNQSDQDNKRISSENRRDTRVRFMLGGVEQIGQGVAGSVPAPDLSSPSTPCGSSRRDRRLRHIPIQTRTLHIANDPASFALSSSNSFSRRSQLAKLDLASIRISSEEARERTPAMERAVNVVGVCGAARRIRPIAPTPPVPLRAACRAGRPRSSSRPCRQLRLLSHQHLRLAVRQKAIKGPSSPPQRRRKAGKRRGPTARRKNRHPARAERRSRDTAAPRFQSPR